jgi:hypothetical protein
MLSFWKLIEWWNENKNEEKCEKKEKKMKKIEKKKWRKQKRALWNVNQDNEKC